MDTRRGPRAESPWPGRCRGRTVAVAPGGRGEEASVRGVPDGPLDRRPEAGPPRPAVVLRVRRKEGQIAGGTDERAPAVFLVQRARAGTLRPLLAQDTELLGSQHLPPLGLGLADLEPLGRRHVRSLRAGVDLDGGRAAPQPLGPERLERVSLRARETAERVGRDEEAPIEVAGRLLEAGGRIHHVAVEDDVALAAADFAADDRPGVE